MRYDLRKGTFQEAWETFIPSLADPVRGRMRSTRSIAVPANGGTTAAGARFTAGSSTAGFPRPWNICARWPGRTRRFKEDWRAHHRRYFEIAGITLQVDSDLPIDDQTFHPKFEAFRVDGPGPDTVTIRHHFSLPDLEGKDLGLELYRKPPWAIYRQNGSYHLSRNLAPGRRPVAPPSRDLQQGAHESPDLQRPGGYIGGRATFIP